MAEHLASYGYVVVSADHPLSNAQAPGGATYLDVVNQPSDVSFLIDHVMGNEASARSFKGSIDPERIGVFGISLGGATATLTAFHPEWRDSRVAAAISIAGPGDVFGSRFFEHASVPFLMIAGTSDAIVDYEINASKIPERISRGGLLTIKGATHAGHTYVTSGLLRVLGNPDSLGCSAVPKDAIPRQSVFVGLLGSVEQGLVTPSQHRPPCAITYEKAMRAGRQQEITTLAVHAFFESQFAESEEVREDYTTFLVHTLPAELTEVDYSEARLNPGI